MPSLQALHDKVILKKIPDADRTAAGLYVPATVQPDAKVFRGEVLSVGTGVVTATGQTLDPGVAVGDIVIAPVYAQPSRVPSPTGEEWYAIRIGDLIAKVGA